MSWFTTVVNTTVVYGFEGSPTVVNTTAEMKGGWSLDCGEAARSLLG